MESVGPFDYKENQLLSFVTNSSSLLDYPLSLTSLIYRLSISNLSLSTRKISEGITIPSSPLKFKLLPSTDPESRHTMQLRLQSSRGRKFNGSFDLVGKACPLSS